MGKFSKRLKRAAALVALLAAGTLYAERIRRSKDRAALAGLARSLREGVGLSNQVRFSGRGAYRAYGPRRGFLRRYRRYRRRSGWRYGSRR